MSQINENLTELSEQRLSYPIGVTQLAIKVVE